MSTEKRAGDLIIKDLIIIKEAVIPLRRDSSGRLGVVTGSFHVEGPTYCPACAWVALTPSTRTYCPAMASKFPTTIGVAGWGSLGCSRVPGHDGPHIACSPYNRIHTLVRWDAPLPASGADSFDVVVLSDQEQA